MGILKQIKQERLRLLKLRMKPTSINLTVDQGFDLLEELQHGIYPDRKREEAQMILITRNEKAIIDFLNGSRLIGIDIFVRPLVISSKRLR